MPKTIILVEDDAAITDVYETILRQNKFEVFSIMSGNEALKKVEEIKEGKAEKPDLVLLDLILPDINGIKVLELIRKYSETKDIPVFILTNYSSRELKKMGYNLEAENYLTKTDFTPTQLLEIIKEKLRH
jgi:DNA-binding response OmpR family regulator